MRVFPASLVFVLALDALGAPARAQRGGEVPAGDETLTPTQLDPTTCERTKPTPNKQKGVDITNVKIDVRWKDYEITGDFVDPPETVRQLLDPIMERFHVISEEAREQIEEAATSFGYQVIGLGTRETPQGINAHLHLAPLPMVRTLDVKIRYPGLDFLQPLLEDEIRRRMRSRVGSYLPWAPDQRNCRLYLEKRRIEEFLHDEGYFDSVVTVDETVSGVGVSLRAAIDLGTAYKIDINRIEIPGAGGLRIDEAEIRERFRPEEKCYLGAICVRGSYRWTRAKHQASLQKVIDLFHKRGFPAVRVRSDDPSTMIDRRRHTVQFTLTIDPRRQVDVSFEGVSVDAARSLQAQLTFDQAASADDVEANNSARAVTSYLQSRGYFDARVTWRRESFPEASLDKLIYRIEQGRRRTVADVKFVGNRQPFASEDALKSAIATKERQLSSTILGATTYATSATLASDVDRLVMLYRRKGFRDARVRVDASTDPHALGSAALTAALISANRGKDLYVQFTIDEGEPTLLTELRVDLGDKGDAIPPGQEGLCTEVLKDLAELYKHAAFAKQLPGNRCVSRADTSLVGMGARRMVAALTFREDDAAATKDQLKNKLFARGRPRADVAYEPIVLGPHSVVAHYTLDNLQLLVVGKVVLRGNFRTRPSIIYGELQLKEGQPLTTDALGESIRQLRNTALFESVNIHMPALQATTAGAVNAVVDLTERYDYRASVDFETGFSSFNGAFVKAGPSFKNLFGIGASLDLAGTIGFDVGTLPDFKQRQLAAESTLRFPQWLPKHIGSPIDFHTEINAFHRKQDTPRFGILTTTGATLALSRTWQMPRTATRREASARTVGIHYDFRRRERNVDVLRPIGADDDDSQVPITTRTGLVGLTGEWEQRVDRSGQLSPLAPEGGFRLEGQFAIASPVLYGQDTFIKVSGAGSKFWSAGPHLVLRLDGRYDQGIPLGGAALLPEVERFFAGGDSTVRGYDDDRLATEIVQVGVPPLDNITQIRVLPAGGNIRALASADAQLRVYKLLSTAVFFDAGLITNQWSTVTVEDIRPSVGMALLRIVTPFGSFAFERAVPLRPRLGDDPRGRWHISFAARAQF